MTNSLASTDQLMVYAGYSNQRKNLLARGVEVWEFSGCDHFHAKSALIDGCIAVIGSYNFDPRSEHLNTETAVVARDPYVAHQLLESMDAHFANAWRIVAEHGDFVLYETQAVVRYLDALIAEPALTPETAREAARMNQLMGIVDCYVFPSISSSIVSAHTA